MRICFIDNAELDYSASSPLKRPLGGMQSAMCYLSIALAERGHDVTLVNRSNSSQLDSGVSCVSGREWEAASGWNNHDAIVSISCVGTGLRDLGIKCPLIFWPGHDVDQSALNPLSSAREKSAWDRIAMVSEWQADRFTRAFQIDPRVIRIMRYAAGPGYLGQFRSSRYFFEEGRPPVLIYSSTPFRGLHVLAEAFPLIRERFPESTLQIYSSTDVYFDTNQNRPFEELYQKCRDLPGATYSKAVSQSELMAAYFNSDILAYPSTFAETSCITMMEAMSSGLLMLCNSLGALPETSAGFAHFTDLNGTYSVEALARAYAEKAISTITEAYERPQIFKDRLDEQQTYSRQNNNWRKRAEEWEEFLGGMIR